MQGYQRGEHGGVGHDMACMGNTDSPVEPGMCVNNCGRKVREGLRPSGAPWETCCRGCARGSHDVFCGKPVADQQLDGFCRMGCGRPAAIGTGGQQFETCCKGCACGLGHSPHCKATDEKDAVKASTHKEDAKKAEEVARQRRALAQALEAAKLARTLAEEKTKAREESEKHFEMARIALEQARKAENEALQACKEAEGNVEKIQPK